MKQLSRDKVGLTTGEWALLILAVLLALLFLWVAIKFIAWTIDRSEQISMTLGVFALAVSAYAAITSQRIKQYEISKGYLTAKTLVEVDTALAVSDSWQLYNKLREFHNDASSDWNQAISKTISLAKLYEKRQDQMPLLLSNLPYNKILNTQRLYIQIQEHLEETSKLLVDTSASRNDIDSNYENRKITIHKEFLPSVIKIIDTYRQLEYTSISELLEDEEVFAKAVKHYTEYNDWYEDGFTSDRASVRYANRSENPAQH